MPRVTLNDRSLIWTAVAAVALAAVLVVPITTPAQSPSEPQLLIFHGGGSDGGAYVRRTHRGSGIVLSDSPVTINVDDPGYLIQCGRASPSDGAAIEYEFLALEPRGTDDPDPRTEAAVRRLSDGFARSEPDYDLMTPCMAQTARGQLDELRERFSSLGAIGTVPSMRARAAQASMPMTSNTRTDRSRGS